MAGPGETPVVHRSWHLLEFPWQPSIPGRSSSPRQCKGSLCLRASLEAGGWVHASLVGTIYSAPGPHCLDTKPPLGGTFSGFHRAPLPTGSVSPMSPAQKTILLASTCPSFLLGWGTLPFLIQVPSALETLVVGSQGVLQSPSL